MKRNKFSLSHHKLATFDMGQLVPIACLEVLPGDSIQQATSALLRTTPLTAPVMHPVDVLIHHWFVPYRLVWNDWEDFITGGEDGDNASVLPTITFGSGINSGTLADYLGCPTTAGSFTVNALPFRAYAKVWNEFYRDQDLSTALTIDLTDGADTTTNTTLKQCNWEKDFFTTARPWTQKGDEVMIPLTDTTPPVTGIGKNTATYPTTNPTPRETDGTGTVTYAKGAQFHNSGGDNIWYGEEDPNNTGFPNIRANLANAMGSIIDLREAQALQKFAEARGKWGSRYAEYLQHLGVNSDDARLQRPQYLGGGKQTLQFSEVLQTGPDFDSNDGVGTLRGHGIGAMRSNRYRRFFKEHGMILSLVSVKPKTIYADGAAKFWKKSAKEDFFQKELQFIGQDEVLNQEVYAEHTTPTGVFGYQDRYDEYRRHESQISGEFRESQYNNWHFARRFTSDPALNANFVECSPTKTPFLDQSNDQILGMFRHSIQARRMLAKSGSVA